MAPCDSGFDVGFENIRCDITCCDGSESDWYGLEDENHGGGALSRKIVKKVCSSTTPRNFIIPF